MTLRGRQVDGACPENVGYEVVSTLADQLKGLGLQPVERPVQAPNKPKSAAGGRPPRPPVSNETVFLQLPRFGTVARLEEEHGFGFISVSGSEDVFFHFRGFPGKLPDGQKLPSAASMAKVPEPCMITQS